MKWRRKSGTVPSDSVIFLRIYVFQSYAFIVFIDFIPMNRFPVSQFPVDRFPIPRFPMYRLPVSRFPVTRFPVYRFSVYRSLFYLLFGGTDHLSFGSVIVGIYTGLWFIQEIILNPKSLSV